MILVAGDTHGEIDKFEQIKMLKLSKNDTLIVLGDFGFIWDCYGVRNNGENKQEEQLLNRLNAQGYTICFIDGNHENFQRLNNYPLDTWKGGRVHKIRDNIYHLMRGEIYEIEEKKIFTFGGASSHDIQDGILSGEDWREEARQLERFGRTFYRVEGISWWKEELPSEEEMRNGIENLSKHNFEVDYVLTHCLPTSQLNFIGNGTLTNDTLTDYFQSLLDEHNIKFKKWKCGHYHIDKDINRDYRILYNKFDELK